MELGLIWLAVQVGGAGVAIILFTIFVRLVLSPLQITQLRNAKAMQRIQPLVKELQNKHGKDKQALTQATMGLYKEHGVNPAMGCLPTLLQFPILIGLFYALLHLGATPSGWPKLISWAKSTCNGLHPHSMGAWLQQCYAIKGASSTPTHVFDLFHAHFLWLNHGLGLPDPYYILPVLAGATQWIQSRMMLTKTSDPQQQMMNSMMNFMPLMIVIFALRYPSGLSLYWVTSTIIGIVIQARITGLGLLHPSQGGLPGTVAALISRSGSAPAPRPSAPKRPATKPAAPQQKQVSAIPSETYVEENGASPVASDSTVQDGASNGRSSPNGATRPRKKANRARGGKSGGRRG
jgi:YidC/Oxa1 family membrane protein insertase